MSDDEREKLSGSIKRETDKAILFSVDNGPEIWIPRSVIPYMHKDSTGHVELEVEQWWMDKHYND
jgi:hypothetical protein